VSLKKKEKKKNVSNVPKASSTFNLPKTRSRSAPKEKKQKGTSVMFPKDSPSSTYQNPGPGTSLKKKQMKRNVSSVPRDLTHLQLT
jgi:hypothetical protein